VETKAKARAARDLGISTELALDMDDAPVGEVVGTVVTAEAVSQEATQSSEAPKQLPKPTSEPGRKLLPGQFNALKSLYLRLGEGVPKDLDKWTFEQASATITGLQARTRP
jgi:hypothetical protein